MNNWISMLRSYLVTGKTDSKYRNLIWYVGRKNGRNLLKRYFKYRLLLSNRVSKFVFVQFFHTSYYFLPSWSSYMPTVSVQITFKVKSGILRLNLKNDYLSRIPIALVQHHIDHLRSDMQWYHSMRLLMFHPVLWPFCKNVEPL